MNLYSTCEKICKVSIWLISISMVINFFLMFVFKSVWYAFLISIISSIIPLLFSQLFIRLIDVARYVENQIEKDMVVEKEYTTTTRKRIKKAQLKKFGENQCKCQDCVYFDIEKETHCKIYETTVPADKHNCKMVK